MLKCSTSLAVQTVPYVVEVVAQQWKEIEGQPNSLLLTPQKRIGYEVLADSRSVFIRFASQNRQKDQQVFDVG